MVCWIGLQMNNKNIGWIIKFAMNIRAIRKRESKI